MRNKTFVALALTSAVSFSLGAAVKQLNHGNIEALNSILEARTGIEFALPPDPCFATPAGLPPDPCVNLRVTPSSGLAQQVEFSPASGASPALQITVGNPARPDLGPSRITVLDSDAVGDNFLVVDGMGNALTFCPGGGIIHPPPG